MNRTYRTLSTMLGGLVAVALAIASPSAWADDDDDDMEIPFDEHEIFFELNYTDEDLGIHALIDGEAWKRLKIERDDNGRKVRKLLDIRIKGNLRKQGLTELFFESAEPEFEDLDPAAFFARFPAGIYDVEGVTLEGDELESEMEITHLLPAPAETSVNGMEAAEDCDTPLMGVMRPVVITWDEVDESIDPMDEGFEGFPPIAAIEVVSYQVVAEIDEEPFNVSAILGPDARSFQIPAELLDLAVAKFGGAVKFEVLVREESFNQTGVESCFVLAP